MKTYATILIAMSFALSFETANADDFVIGPIIRDQPTPPPQLTEPPYVRLRGISHAGSACPAGTVAINLSPDARAFTLLWDSFIAEIGPDIPYGTAMRSCQILVDLDYPQGWQYTVSSVDLSGYASLERGVDATVTTRYYFQGEMQTATLSSTLRGPYDGDFRIRDTLGLSAEVWSPCGAQRALNFSIRASLRAMSRSSRGLLTLDSPYGNRGTPFSIRWRRC